MRPARRARPRPQADLVPLATSRLSFAARLSLLLGAAAVLLLTAAGAPPLERAEIYFVDGARSMVERGDSVVPYHRGERFFDKPPLAYWLIAAAFRALGFSLEAARLVPALAALAAILASVWMGALLLDRETGLLGGLVLATTGIFVSFGRMAMSDMLLTLASTAAVASAVALLDAPASRRSAYSALLAAALGLGFLAKGPVALLLPGLGVLALAWTRRQQMRGIAGHSIALGVLAFLGVVLPWFVLVQLRVGWQPIGYFFLHENLERFAGETYDSSRSALYYLAVYGVEGLPWSLLLPLALWRLRREPRADSESSGGAALLALWIGLMLVPLSLSRGKIDYYLLPAYPPASLLVARVLRSSRTRSEALWMRTLLVVTAGAVMLAPSAWAGLPGSFLPTGRLLGVVRVGCWALSAALLFGASRFSLARFTGLIAAASAASSLAVTGLFVPALRRAQPNTAIVADVVRERSFRPDLRLVYCEDPTRVERDLLFEARLASLQRCDLWAPAASRFPFLLLVPERQRETLGVATRFVGEYRYVPASVSSLPTLFAGVRDESLVLLANYSTRDPEADLRMRKDRKRRVRERERLEAGGSRENAVP